MYIFNSFMSFLQKNYQALFPQTNLFYHFFILFFDWFILYFPLCKKLFLYKPFHLISTNPMDLAQRKYSVKIALDTFAFLSINFRRERFHRTKEE